MLNKRRLINGKKSKISCILAVIALIILCFAPGVNAEENGDAENETDFPEINVTKKTLDTWLGEGEFIGIHNQDRDAMMGVLYGTASNPNFIYIISVHTRYIGVADVYDNDGKLLKKGHAIPVRTLFAQRFCNIFEFDDADNDGIFDSRKRSAGSEAEELMEPVFKRASLHTAWSASDVTKIETGNTSKEWTFSLTARDLKYRKPFGVVQVSRDNALEVFSLTFHLYVDVEENSKENVPHFKVTVSERGSDNYNVESCELIENREYSGRAVDASFKYDHSIKGWDFSSTNGNCSLMLSTGLIFANAVSDEAAGWLSSDHENLLEKIGSSGKGAYEDASGQNEISMASAADNDAFGDDTENIISGGTEKPRLIKKNRLHFQDNWQNLGGLEWVSDVTVDNVQKDMYFQVYGGSRFLVNNPGRGAMRGFWVIGGFSYPGGSDIYHDPQFNSRAVSITVERADQEIEREEESEGVRPIVYIVIIAIAVVIVAALIYLIVARVAKKEEKAPEEDGWDEGPDEY